MGAKDSKPSFIAYEEAVKRVPDSELRRIREAFKRCASGNGATLSHEAFVHDVLCDGVPSDVAEWLFQACGGTKRGIAFKDLLCGIVVLTKGSVDEKIKFLWTLYVNNQNENGLYIYKWDFARTLHLENTSLPVTNAPKTAEILTGLFGSSDKVTFEQFRSWLLIHKDATVLSKWLLSEKSYNSAQDLETPTFYQSLAGVTHLEERDIIELEKCFWSLRTAAATSQLDLESLAPLLAPPLPPAAVRGAFLAFDENRDGHVDFKELCCGLSAACRGPRTERLKFCFKIFDLDRDGVLNRRELADMVGILCQVAGESAASRCPSPDGETPAADRAFAPEAILADLKDKLVLLPRVNRPVFQLGPTGVDTDDQESIEVKSEEGGAVLTLEDFLIWSVESAEALVSPFLELVFELCHVVLGLRPQCPHQEKDIVLGWLRRANARGLSVGHFWYLVGAEWWQAWRAHCAAPRACCRRHDDGLGTDDSLTTNSTESMGSLLYRADTASLGSASSSGVSSAGNAPHPGPIDNKRLLAANLYKVRTLTGEGGHLRRDVTLAQHRDFELVPDALWRALALWYGGPDPLPRQVIRPPDSDVELELYPLELKILRHVATPQRSSLGLGAAGAAGVLYGASGGGAGGGSGGGAPSPPEKQLAYTAAFSRLATVKQVSEFLCSALGLSRDQMRLWSLSGNGAVLLDDDRPRLSQLQLDSRRRLLLELRNPDLTWPEEIGALSMSQASAAAGGGAGGRRGTLRAPDLPGATGLHNLGNTCYMNAALQSVWNTGPLTRYFNAGMHLYEVNAQNPLGTRGALARRFGELCNEVWSMRARSVAPWRVRVCVARWARGLAGGGQHDAQELLAWLLDALHEDLNRATPPAKPLAPPASKADDTQDTRDQVAAADAWSAHCARNRSIVTELFYGQLKSKVRCAACGHESVRFDAFNMLSLPLPMEAALPLDVRVVLLDGSVPVRYGVRVPADGTYRDLKQRLSPLCHLPPDLMLVVEVSGAVISRVLSDGARARPGPALVVYELPATEHDDAGGDTEWPAEVAEGAEGAEAAGEGSLEGSSSAQVSAAPSLCMPALFCFKRSRSEMLMSQSPPGLCEARACHNARCNTLPKERERHEGNSSPTLSVKSLNIRPSTPRLKVQFGSSPCDMHHAYDTREQPLGSTQYLVAVHRKQCRLDAYFLPGGRSRPALFGAPVLVPLREHMSGRELYDRVWTQLARLLSARPATHGHNHATDCDDSLGYEFPFTLRLVGPGGCWCCLCPWSALCRGCALPTSSAPLVHNLRTHTHAPAGAAGTAARVSAHSTPPPAGLDTDSLAARAKRRQCTQHDHDGADGSELSRLDFQWVRQARARAGGGAVMLAIDWDPTALHLRYQAAREKACIEHESVRECALEAARPIDLDHCLGAFTSEERLEEPYHCSGCRGGQPATKKLQVWRLPPILVIHLKRFQYVNNKWIKSQKVVNFPYQDFDPTAYLASVPQETILRHHELKHMFKRRVSRQDDISDISESETDDEGVDLPKRASSASNLRKPASSKRRESEAYKRQRRESSSLTDAPARQRLESSSLVTTPVLDHALEDYHQHRLTPDQDPFDVKYRLYAVVSHSGQLSGGHYVAYARNPTGAWLCYNDSMCRELAPPPPLPIDPASAYLLFYERQGLDTEAYLPDITGKEPVSDTDAPDADENDLRKMCVIA